MSHDIDGTTIGRIERHKIPDDRKRLSDELEGVPFFGSIERDMAESNAGTLARQDVWLMDLWHRAEGDREEFRTLLFHEAEEEMKEAYSRSFEAFKELRTFFNETDLRWLSQEVIENKMMEQVQEGGSIERLGVDKMAEHLEADEKLHTQAEIAAETGIRNPEAAGIDAVLMVDGEPIALQIKMDEGGQLPDDHPADYLVRVFKETGRVRYWD